jgi:2-iminoacetate synthase
MSFYEEIAQLSWPEVAGEIVDRSEASVLAALSNPNPLGFDDLLSLLSPAAEPFLEEMALRAHRVTERRFGKVISLFAPLYLSNECANSCAYCGFNRHNAVDRLTLSPERAVAEAGYLRDLGFRNLLLVSGEASQIVTLPYLLDIVERLGRTFSSISIEIYPMETSDYKELTAGGVDGLVVFQETYNEKGYAEFHPAGAKRDFRRRLETPERGGEAGFRRLGLGALLGLANWRAEGFFLAMHARFLMRKYWKSFVSISFPRLQPAAGGFQPPRPVSDTHFVQLLTALRLFLPDAGLVLSTRESSYLRDHLIPLGITSMSAGSRTDPGGYLREAHAEAQFEVSDARPAGEVARVITAMGYEPVWKDWDRAFLA